MNGNIKKKRVNKKEKKILDAIEQSGMTLVKSGSDYLKSDGYYSIDTILVTKLTKELIDTDWLSGPPITKEGRDDICHDQGQVDDLLTSLGF